MALYDNKYWLLSHIRNSFISTDDTGTCELVMVGEDINPLKASLEHYPDPNDKSDSDDDDLTIKSCDIGMDFGMRARTNTAAKIEKLENARKKIAKMKIIKWNEQDTTYSKEQLDEMFQRVEPKQPQINEKSSLSEKLKQRQNLPQNPFNQFAKFDGSGQSNVPIRHYKIFLTMLSEDYKNVPLEVSCIATAKIRDLIGLILYKISGYHGDLKLHSISHYALYITEEDGEVYRDLPHLEPKECVAKYGFTCLGLVEHNNPELLTAFSQMVITDTVELDSVDAPSPKNNAKGENVKSAEFKQDTNNMLAMETHQKAMEAPTYQSFRVYLVTKMRLRVEVQLGISGDKLEIDPIQSQNSKFSLTPRQKPASYPMNSIAWCELVDRKNEKSTFRIVYSTNFTNSLSKNSASCGVKTAVANFSPLQSSASFKNFDFESDVKVAEDIVAKINLILDLKSSQSR